MDRLVKDRLLYLLWIWKDECNFKVQYHVAAFCHETGNQSFTSLIWTYRGIKYQQQGGDWDWCFEITTKTQWH